MYSVLLIYIHCVVNDSLNLRKKAEEDLYFFIKTENMYDNKIS